MTDWRADYNTGGLKYDGDKPPLELLSTSALNELGRVLGYGAEKYARNNWREGIVYSRLVSATMRHLLAFNDGEDLDPETGLSHVAHAMCSLMFLEELRRERPELDDRRQRLQAEANDAA